MSESSHSTISISNSISKPDEVTKRLLELIDRCNYQLVQENGQRRLTSTGSEPRTKGAEIFLGRLPRDCYEDELVPLLSKVGRVVELRLMMDFSGSTRGYAFALFEQPKIARRACEQLNSYEIRPGHKIGVVKSIDNCRLFLGGVPKDKTRADFTAELSKILDGITNIYVYPSTEDKAQNRGFVFVEFKDHRSAAMARRKLIPGRVMLWDHEIAVDWADPEPGQDIDDEIMETVSALFVRNLALNATEAEIKCVLQLTTGVPLMKIKKINHFAFLHYVTRAQAQRVLDIMKVNRSSETSDWEITWAKPIRKMEKLQEGLRCAKNVNQGNLRAGQLDQGRKNQTPKTEKIQLGQSDRTSTGTPDSSSSSTGGSHKPDSKLSINSTLGMQQAPIHPYYEGYYGYNYPTNSVFNDRPHLANDPPICRYGDDNFNVYAKALGELAANEFHANLRYEYCTDALEMKHYCKVVLERNGCELMSYQGTPAATVHDAVRFTLQNAYASLQAMLINRINDKFN